MLKKYALRSSVAAFAFGFVVATTPAHAGFEWVAPNDGASYQQTAQPSFVNSPPPSSATSMPEVISPVVISGDTRPMAPTPRYYPSAAPATSPPLPIVATDTQDTAADTISVSSSATEEKVQGFAFQIPLTLALRQLLPPGYNFSIDQDVDMNTLVSYKGGKPWRDTLRDALVPAGLVGREQGQSVMVSHSGRNDAQAVNSPPPSLPPLETPRSVAQASYLVPPSSARAMDNPTYATTLPDNWTAPRGDTLRKVLVDWCSRAGVELQWQAEYDYPIEASAHFTNGFEDAVRNLLAGFDGARPQPIGELHTNSTAGQMVLVVQARGNNYSN